MLCMKYCLNGAHSTNSIIDQKRKRIRLSRLFCISWSLFISTKWSINSQVSFWNNKNLFQQLRCSIIYSYISMRQNYLTLGHRNIPVLYCTWLITEFILDNRFGFLTYRVYLHISDSDFSHRTFCYCGLHFGFLENVVYSRLK